MIDDINQQIGIAATPQRVWEVLTTEGLVEQWLGCLDYQARIGHVFYMQPDAATRAAGDLAGATHCELLRLDPPREMVFSWYYPETPRTEVAIRLTPDGGGTRVDLVHSGWDQFDPEQIRMIRDALAGGWSSFVLPGLKRLAETQ
ncbi:SRPBCC domain-containing protein [Allosphingosinicella sp.]|uniref:SRPBCC family protein n=1 Tax=Allosphingosinicella sp. TaxID=2823234 RepID=UPI003783F7B9